MRRGQLTTLIVCAVGALTLLAASGCGDTAETETVQRHAVPTVSEGKVEFEDIKHTAQAGNFTGTQKEVASDIDRIVIAINNDDAAFMCKQGYTNEDLEILNQGGACEKTVKALFGAYAGYQLDIEEIKVQGDTAKVQTRVITAFKKEKEPMVQPIPMRFKKQDGSWRMDLNLKQKTEEAPPSDSVGTVEDDKSTAVDESTDPRE